VVGAKSKAQVWCVSSFLLASFSFSQKKRSLEKCKKSLVVRFLAFNTIPSIIEPNRVVFSFPPASRGKSGSFFTPGELRDGRTRKR